MKWRFLFFLVASIVWTWVTFFAPSPADDGFDAESCIEVQGVVERMHCVVYKPFSARGRYSGNRDDYRYVVAYSVKGRDYRLAGTVPRFARARVWFESYLAAKDNNTKVRIPVFVDKVQPEKAHVFTERSAGYYVYRVVRVAILVALCGLLTCHAYAVWRSVRKKKSGALRIKGSRKFRTNR